MKMTVEIEDSDIDSFLSWRSKLNRSKDQANKKRLEDTEIDVRGLKCLQDEGIIYLEDAQAMSDRELLYIPNFGRKSLILLRSLK